MDDTTVHEIEDWIEGDCLIVPERAKLPARCIKTNAPVNDSEYFVRTVTYTPSWTVFALPALGPLLFLFGLFGVQKSCYVKFGLKKSIYLTSILKRITASLLFFTALITLIISAIYEFTVVIVLSFIFCIAALSYLVLGQKALRAIKYENGNFWLQGCSPEFIASLRENP